MWGAIAGAGLSALSSTIGGLISRNQAKKAKRVLDKNNKFNEDQFNRRYNEDYLQTSAAQRALNKAYDSFQHNLRSARGAQAVMGGTEEGVASAMESANNGMSNTMADIAANGTARQDAIFDNYQENKNRISQEYMNMYNQRAANASAQASNAAQGFMNVAAADISSMLDSGKGIFGDQFKGKSKSGGFSFTPKTFDPNPFKQWQ